MRRRLAIIAVSLCSVVALGVPASSAVHAETVKPAATAGCLWVLTYQVCLPNLFA